MNGTEELPAAGIESPARPEPEAPLPVDELDRLLAPLRRVLTYAVRDEAKRLSEVRYLGVIGARLVEAAVRLDLPHAVRDLLAVIAGRMPGFDEATFEDRRERAEIMYQHISRLDALLGLPLEPTTRAASARPAPASEEEEEDAEAPATEASGRREERRKGRGRRERPTRAPGRAPAPTRAKPEAAPRAVRAEPSPRPAEDEAPRPRPGTHRPGDPAHTGRSLADVGVPADLVEALAAADVETIADLLLLPTTGEEVLRPIHGAGREMPEERVAVGGRVRRRVVRLSPDGRRETEVILWGAGPQVARWPGGLPGWMLAEMTLDARVVLVGEHRGGVLHGAELAVDDGSHAARLQRYGVDGADDATVRALLWRVLPDAANLRDPLPAESLRRAGLIELGEAVGDVHRKGGARPEARRRLAFEDALLGFLGLALPRPGQSRERGIGHPIAHGLATRMSRIGDFVMSDSQQLALEEIKRDLRSSSPMLRVLTGDVASGKGLVALLAAAIVAENKAQTLFLAPDDVSAEVRFLFAEPLLRDVGLVARLFVGEPGRGQLDALRRGEIHVVFGSDALLDASLEFRRLGLVISEERERFGTTAAKVAALKPPRPDALVLTATPVASEVLLSAYGNHDVSVVRDEARVPVAVRIVPSDRREEAYAHAREALEARRQVYVVFPMTRGSDAIDGREAQRVKAALEAGVFPGARVALFHGAMGREERWRVFDDFRHHRLDVLVATTRFEDGPPVPSGTVAIVEQADRANLVRLRRVRGHLSKATAPGGRELLLVTGEEPEPDALARLEVFARGTDEELAESLLPPEGVEAVLAAEAPRAPALRWLDPARDREVLGVARAEARRILQEDPTLRRGNHSDLARLLRDRWDELFAEPCPLGEGAATAAGTKRRRRRRKRR